MTIPPLPKKVRKTNQLTRNLKTEDERNGLEGEGIIT